MSRQPGGPDAKNDAGLACQPDSPYVACAGFVAETGTPNGLGVFAQRDIGAGETVEISPVVQLRTAFEAMEPVLQHRVFDWERLASISGTSALALGCGSLYNHANPANLSYAACRNGAAIRFAAARDIRRGEELTINYNATRGGPVSDDDVWFMACNVAPCRAPGTDPA